LIVRLNLVSGMTFRTCWRAQKGANWNTDCALRAGWFVRPSFLAGEQEGSFAMASSERSGTDRFGSIDSTHTERRDNRRSHHRTRRVQDFAPLEQLESRILLHSWTSVDIDGINNMSVYRAVDGSSYGDVGQIHVGQKDITWPSPNEFQRGYVWFDLSGIPSGSEISSDTDSALVCTTHIDSGDPDHSFWIDIGPMDVSRSSWVAKTDPQKWNCGFHSSQDRLFYRDSPLVGVNKWLYLSSDDAEGVADKEGAYVGFRFSFTTEGSDIEDISGIDDTWLAGFSYLYLHLHYRAPNVPPTIDGLSASPPGTVLRGTDVTLTPTRPRDSDGPGGLPDHVAYYRDSNSNGTLEIGTDEHLGSQGASGGYALTVNTTSWPRGNNLVFAVSVDDDRAVSNPASVTIDVNLKPDKPSCNTPSNGATGVSLTPTLAAIDFSDPDGDSHLSTQWQVSKNSSFTDIVWDYNDTDGAKWNEAVPSGKLGYGPTYYWRLAYQDGHGAWSDWADYYYFSTASLPFVSISDVTQAEGTGGSTTFNFTVTLSASRASTISVDYATADNTADADSDYVAASNTLYFYGGDTSETVAITVIADSEIENNESFYVNLSNPVNCCIDDETGVGTIVNDDSQNTRPSASVTTPSDTKSGDISIAYTLSDAQSDSCSIQAQYSTNDGATWSTATGGPGGEGVSGLSSSPSGVPHVWVWNSTADLGMTLNSNVQIRITPSDAGGPGTGGTTNSFTVDNTFIWQIAGTADFDNNGSSDLLWWDRKTGALGAWLMTNGQFTSWKRMGTVSYADWEVGGVGDFDHNGYADILWRNKTTGRTGAWLMTNGQFTSWKGIGTASYTDWEIGGVGDLDKNGYADIVWRNKTTGGTGAWLMTNGQITSWLGVGRAFYSDWALCGLGHFDGNGYLDILWHNKTTGLVGAWLLDNGHYQRWKPIGIVL